MVTPDMVAIWQTGSFAKDPPNATVSVFSKDGSSVTDAVVVLTSRQARGRAADLRRHGPGGQPRQGRRPGLGLHRHVVVGRSARTASPTTARARRPAASRPTSAIRTAPAPSPAGPIPRPPGPTFRRRTNYGAGAPARRRRRTSIRATSSASTRRPAASLPSCPATEAIHEPAQPPGRAGDGHGPSRPVGARPRANRRPQPPTPGDGRTGGDARGQDHRPAAAAADRAVDDRAQRAQRQARGTEAHAGRHLAQRHRLRRPAGALGRPCADGASARGMEQQRARQLRQDAAQRHRVGVQQGQGRRASTPWSC